ncbi:unnamed protein product [Fusarium graminearum]|uniref:Chromosome 4, complete genome n=1 Tax=Gibberella zeae (strain ATCC MYA-4620 / CBS 123657 / FGSC 9075 / NRRL 31084 / PH-1) TaxID=229533 RepID=I1RTL2_GIBZE|nr:hypothetical protein FGSG_07521 [Fusarium graminearum PH-1]ESU13790.1 hypothetical protein FGSG_07521 [Fusarium graminearum PH-1]EYB27556.1 hypothetical protein FG05_07521 [Fusarium graminearum]CEF82836.1 unnamed protein product [Fusarium graminearum]CZS73417.1 unnamed protein product [Fusarium graminearum]|eukprot:XP_011327297.1 hypothetical protein FGSG_07521 [Fusarium graminearum PH-1]
MDWSILGLDQPLIEPQSIDTDHLIATPPISDDTCPAPSAQVTIVSQLTDLMAIFDRMQNSPPASLTQHLTLRKLNEFMKICDVNVGAFLEELLQSAQKLVHLYPQVLKQLEPRVPMLPPECEPRLDIPEIKIGSFVAPKISAASMVIALVIELQTSLNARAQDLHDVVSSNLGHDARTAKILGLQCESLKEHATQTGSDLHSLREHLQNLGVIG